MLFDSFFFRCLKVAFFSAEMKAELEKAKKEADAAKKVKLFFFRYLSIEKLNINFQLNFRI